MQIQKVCVRVLGWEGVCVCDDMCVCLCVYDVEVERVSVLNNHMHVYIYICILVEYIHTYSKTPLRNDKFVFILIFNTIRSVNLQLMFFILKFES